MDMMIDQIIDQTLPEIEKEFTDQGFEDVKSEKTTVIFKGEEVPAIRTEAVYSGIHLDQIQVFRMSGQYIAIITLTGLDEIVDQLLDYFW